VVPGSCRGSLLRPCCVTTPQVVGATTPPSRGECASTGGGGGGVGGSRAKVGDVLVTLHEPSLQAHRATPLRIAVEVKAGAFSMAGAGSLSRQVPR